jgi:hypothetical protein
MSFDIRLNIFSTGYAWCERFDEALAILERYGARASEQSHSYSVRWDDGSGLAIYSRSLFDSAGDFSALLTPLGGLSQRFCDFTYDFALTVGCAICPDVIPPLTLAVHPAIISELSLRRDERVVRVSSGIAVRNALAEWFRSGKGDA